MNTSNYLKVFILIGIPGAGKSTLVQKIKQFYPNDEFVVINQDKLGSKEVCIETMHAALEVDKNVIIDRCNINSKQRKVWLDITHYYNVKSIHGIFIDVDPEEALARIHLRKNHETINYDMSIEEKRKIVYQFVNTFEYPKLDEGFTSILHIRG